MEVPVAAEAASLGRTFCVRMRELKVDMSGEFWTQDLE
jgi:hypothetical protein